MTRQRLAVLARPLAAALVLLGSALTCAAHGGGHGGGGGHEFAGGGGFGHGGFGHGGFGYRGYGFRGYGYGGYGWFPFGLGLGLGYGLGYGSGWGYGYPYYPYYAYPSVPVYVSPGYGPACPVAGQAPASGAGAPGGPVRLTDMDVLLNIRVPPDAVVRINGQQTTQGGPRREFVSSGLAPGRTYTFMVTARWTDATGKPVELEQRVHVQGGERRNVDFLAPPPLPAEIPVVHRSGG